MTRSSDFKRERKGEIRGLVVEIWEKLRKIGRFGVDD